MNPTPDNPPPVADPPEPEVMARRRAAAMAGHAGDQTVATDLLGDPDPGVRVAALGALARCGAIDDQICTRVASDTDAGVRRRLAEELGRHRPDDPTRRHTALQTALALLGDPDVMVAEAAAWSVGELAGPTPNTDGNIDGIDGIGNIDDRSGQQPDCGPDGDIITRELSAVATNHADPLVRESAVAALGAIGDLNGLAAVLAATTDKPAVRRRAVIALASFLDEPGVTEALQRATTDRDWQVRQAADMLLDSSD